MNDGLINYRFPSKGTPASGANGYFITDYFDFDYAAATGLRIVDGVANIGGLGTANYGNCKIVCYDAQKTIIGHWYISRRSAATERQFTVDGDDLVISDLASNKSASIGSLADIADWTTVKYIRLGLALNNAASAIGSVSDVLNSGMKIYAE